MIVRMDELADSYKEYTELVLFGIEFSYLSDSIDILINTYDKKFKKLDKKYKKRVDKLIKLDTYHEFCDEEMEYTYGDITENDFDYKIRNLESFANIIIESLLIKQMAIVEDLIIQISFMIQRKMKQAFPPNHNLAGEFTDIHKAVAYIKTATGDEVDIHKSKKWRIIKLLRDMRHKLAHGKRFFLMNEGDIVFLNREIPNFINKNSYVSLNKEFESKVRRAKVNLKPDQKNKWECSVGSDLTALKLLNKICDEFIEEVKDMYGSVNRR